MVKLRQTISLHKTQAEFLASDAMFRAFIGGRGAGKTFTGAIAALSEAGRKPCPGMCVAPTYPNLRDYVIPEFMRRAEGLIAKYNKADNDLELKNGSRVMFRSGDKPDSLRGPTLAWVWLDEPRNMSYEVWQIVIACLRFNAEPGRLWLTTTPAGKQNWIYRRFVTEATEDYKLFKCSSHDNPYLPRQLLKALTDDYGVGEWGRQELGGEFVDPEGALFRRQDFEIIPQMPEGLRLARSWDLAVSVKENADFTAGALCGIDEDCNFYVCDMIHGKWEWPDTRKEIILAAGVDTNQAAIIVEKVAFQLAAVQELRREPSLMDYVIEEAQPDRDKLSRALPLASRARAGKVKLVRGAWNRAFIDEACSFTGDPKGTDDQVDSVTQAYHHLATANQSMEIVMI